MAGLKNAQAQESTGISFHGFDPDMLKDVKTGLETGLRKVEDDLRISCRYMPFRIEYRPTRSGGNIFVSTWNKLGEVSQVPDPFQITTKPGQAGRQKLDAYEFSKYIRDNLVKSKDLVREICAQ